MNTDDAQADMFGRGVAVGGGVALAAHWSPLDLMLANPDEDFLEVSVRTLRVALN